MNRVKREEIINKKKRILDRKDEIRMDRQSEIYWIGGIC